MKRLIAILGLSLTLSLGITSAGAVASYCGPGAYNAHYRTIFQYPTGSYWANQIAHYPDYYAAHNTQFLNKYGC